ncbi:hypothetical protein ACOME3_006278 [Neoechinorhynchus agilis]
MKPNNLNNFGFSEQRVETEWQMAMNHFGNSSPSQVLIPRNQLYQPRRGDLNRYTGELVPVIPSHDEAPLPLKRTKYEFPHQFPARFPRMQQSLFRPISSAMIPTARFKRPANELEDYSTNRSSSLSSPLDEALTSQDSGDAMEKLTSRTSVRTVSIVVSNIVTTFRTGKPINIHNVARKCLNVELQRHSSRVLMAIRKPLGTATIYRTGRVVCNGTSTTKDAYILSRRVARCIQKSGVDFNRMIEYTVVNIFSSVSMPFRIDLYKLYREWERKTLPQVNARIESLSYEPEIHSGTNIRIKDLKVTMKVFHSGHVTVIGPKIRNIEEACGTIYPLFKLAASQTRR